MGLFDDALNALSGQPAIVDPNFQTVDQDGSLP
jgi:hypothetical protein